MVFEALKVKIVCQEEKTTTLLASPNHVSVQLAWSLHNKVNSNKIVLIYLSTLKNCLLFFYILRNVTFRLCMCVWPTRQSKTTNKI